MFDMLKAHTLSNQEDFPYAVAAFLLQQAGVSPHEKCDGGCDAGCQYGITAFLVDVTGIRIDNNGTHYWLKAEVLRSEKENRDAD